MKRTSLYITIAAMMVLAVSCKKDIPDLENTYPGSTSSNGALRNLFLQNAPAVQSFSFNASSGGYFMGTDGATLMVAPNAFLYQNNMPVTGNITLKLQEVYTKSDMIFAGGYTTSYGLPLVSGGEINVTAYQGTQELKLAYSGSVYATIPTTANAPGMKIFRASSFGPTRDFVLADTATVAATPDSSMSSFSYGFGLDSLDWSNCDQYFSMFYNTNTMTDFSVPVPAIFNDTNSMVLITSSYAQFAGRIWDYDETTHQFLCNYYRLPVGLDFTFTIVSEINGTFYYDSRTVTIQENMIITLNPEIATEAEITQNILSL